MIYDGNANQKTNLSVSFCIFISSLLSLDPNDQKSLEGMQKMEKEESPTDATVELDGDDMEGSGEDGDLEGSDSEAAQWADQEQWFGMQWPRPAEGYTVSSSVWHAAACRKLFAVKQDKVMLFPLTFRQTSASSLWRYFRFVCTAVQYSLTSKHSTLEKIKMCFQHLDFKKLNCIFDANLDISSALLCYIFAGSLWLPAHIKGNYIP